MTFSLTSPSAPVPQIGHEGHAGDATPPRLDADSMKERPWLEVHLDNEYVCLRGTGNDVEPSRLSGHVALYLAESTPIKSITLQFRGKARLPAPSSDNSMHLNNSVSTYIICNHDWSFLEGERKHSHTLKAGRHFFPFQLQIGGSLPSSVNTGMFGGASVAYKLRAQAVRPGLNTNLQSVHPVTVLRSFSNEALEYQQTLEIENTWPNKLMYSIMIPHKAWAVTDTLTALVKFSPLVKGVGVVSIGTSIHEVTKLRSPGRASMQEATRIVASVKHDVIAGKAVEIIPRWAMGSSSALASPSSPLLTRTPAGSTTPAGTPGVQAAGSGGGYFSFMPPSSQNAVAGPSHMAQPEPTPEPVPEQGHDDIVTFISLAIPATVMATHSLEPISISHRLRWSILIINPDGHTSELRCSLPLHILDRRLLKEARANTSVTRRLLLGGPEVSPDEEDEVELPTYMAHVRDRIANMYLPEAATVRVSNPLMSPSPNHTPPASGLQTPGIASQSGYASPQDPHSLSHLPHAPSLGDNTPLDWINSELLLSMQQSATTPSEPFVSSSPPVARPISLASVSAHNSDSDRSHPPSNRTSQRQSRASSPERHHSSPEIPAVSGPNETYVHSSNASRNLHGVYTVSMKPFTALAHPHWPRSSSHMSISSITSLSSVSSDPRSRTSGPTTPNMAARSLPDSNMLLQRAYTEVPDYHVAARGFIGGVPPLSSSQGLPSYEEAERVQSRSQPATPSY
ncbi:Arrestin-C domain-containing protein [Mycena kentingensis (nom. inval.)]|nr:Arrestin-C domain-containing protein [Mycena kentingensis (nom. inval.)]